MTSEFILVEQECLLLHGIWVHTSGAGMFTLTWHLSSPPVWLLVLCLTWHMSSPPVWLLVLCVVFCWSLFVFLFFFFWSLYFLRFTFNGHAFYCFETCSRYEYRCNYAHLTFNSINQPINQLINQPIRILEMFSIEPSDLI